VPIVVLGVPIFDTAMVYISRKRRGVSFFRGGIDHTTHRLNRYGIDGLSVALTISLINGALGLIAIFITQASLSEAYVVATTLFFLVVYALWQLEFKATYEFRTGHVPKEDDGNR
jgi:UDP-GlcNAc:undecaprenyl-phosphate GlcNAc-1-phosphate transferase